MLHLQISNREMHRWLVPKSINYFNLYWYNETGYRRIDRWSEKTEVGWKRSSATGKLVSIIYMVGGMLSWCYKTPHRKSCTNIRENSVPVPHQVKRPRLLKPFEPKMDSKSCSLKMQLKECRSYLESRLRYLPKYFRSWKGIWKQGLAMSISSDAYD